MRFLSLFSGIEAASVAWGALGWECVGFSEVERFPSAVLHHHYPLIPNLGDVTKITQSMIEALGAIDLVVFGSPCQDLSVAGKRAGLKGGRSGLFFDAMRIVRWTGARWAVFENVPGLFSSNAGLDFAAVVGEMAGVQPDVPNSGWANTGVLTGPDGLVEWGTLDAQFFGVPQRRRRIFAVRDIGDWRCRPPVLFERHSLSGHPAPRREARQGSTHDLAPCLGASGRGFRNAGDTRGQDAVVAAAGDGGSGPYWDGADIADTLDASNAAKQQAMPEKRRFQAIITNSPTAAAAHTTGAGFWQEGLGTLRGREQDSHENLVVHPSKGCLTPNAPQRTRVYGVDGVAPTLQSEEGRGHGVPTIAIQAGCTRENPDSGPDGIGVREDGIAYTLEARAEVQAVAFRTNAAGQVDCQGDQAAAVTTMTDPCSQFIALSKDYGIHGGGQVAVAFRAAGQDGFTPSEICPPVSATDGGGAGVPTVAIQNALRGKSQNGLGITDDDTMYTLDQGSQHAVAFDTTQITSKANRCNPQPGDPCHPLAAGAHPPAVAMNLRGREGGAMPELDDVASIRAASGGSSRSYVAFDTTQITSKTCRSQPAEGKPCHALSAQAHPPAIFGAMAVRRLTPRECERLQGFPDDYTRISDKTADGSRYKSLGNSMAVPVMRWIGERIQMVEDLSPPA